MVKVPSGKTLKGAKGLGFRIVVYTFGVQALQMKIATATCTAEALIPATATSKARTPLLAGEHSFC